MRIVSIPKKAAGKFRTIYIPDREEMASLRSIAGNLEKKSRQICPDKVVHGFTVQRNTVTNAKEHIGYRYTLCFDLADFFDTVTITQLKGKLTLEEMTQVLVDGSARQGLPTSPAVANIAASDMDRAVLKWRDKKKYDVTYTRYADDLTLSYNDPQIADEIKKTIPQIVNRCGFRINPSKTHLMDAKNGRRVITGIGVDADGIYPTRKAKRRLRAALHQKKVNEARGLAEWCKLKPPRERIGEEISESDLAAVLKAWNLPKISIKKLPDKRTEYLADSLVISGDPIYMLGMSTWTTGWHSCMSQPNGAYRKGVLFWTFLPGTRVAALLSDNTTIVAGVERRRMRARALLHELRNGVLCYDRIYGNPGDTDLFREALEKEGIIPVSLAERRYSREKVKGHAPQKYKPYFDSLTGKLLTAKSGPWKGKKVRVAELRGY
jgi:hypothetical protein